MVKANGTTEDTAELLTFEQTADNDAEPEELVHEMEEVSITSDGLTHQRLVEGTEHTDNSD